LNCDSLGSLSIRNLPSLQNLELNIFRCVSLDSAITSQVLDYLPSIEYLTLKGVLDNFNLDSFVKLKCLSLCECLTGEFNFDLLRNILCYQLEELCLKLENLDDECLSKLLYGCHFPVLKTLSISSSNRIEKVEKKLFVGFPMLQTLSISNNRRLRKIDSDVFSNLKQLISLDLSGNKFDSSNLDRWHFWGLDKLKYLNLSRNAFKTIDENMFSRLKELKVLDLSENRINKLSANSFAGLENLISLNINTI
jgi:Leucine-rich repeat (LRR) protein